MSPLGKHLLNLVGDDFILHGRDIYSAYILFSPTGNLFLGYLSIKWFAESLGIKIINSIY